MTATMTPAPIFEDLAIRDLENHFHDEVACDVGDAPAVARLIQRCKCHEHAPVCKFHLETHLATLVYWLNSTGVTCLTCGEKYNAPQTPADIVDVVSL